MCSLFRSIFITAVHLCMFMGFGGGVVLLCTCATMYVVGLYYYYVVRWCCVCAHYYAVFLLLMYTWICSWVPMVAWCSDARAPQCTFSVFVYGVLHERAFELLCRCFRVSQFAPMHERKGVRQLKGVCV